MGPPCLTDHLSTRGDTQTTKQRSSHFSIEFTLKIFQNNLLYISQSVTRNFREIQI